MKILKFGLMGLLCIGSMAWSGCSSTSAEEPQDNNVAVKTGGEGNEQSSPVVEPKEYLPIELSREQWSVNNSTADFGWRLFKEALHIPEIGNSLILSPFSAEVDLAMLANGAAGETQRQIIDALGFAGLEIANVNSYNKMMNATLPDIDNTVNFTMANGLWFAQPFAPYEAYAELVNLNYDASVNSVLFENIVDEVNTWCSEKTKGLISKIISDPCDAVIANAVYFKGNWTHAFDAALTKKDVFHGAKGDADAMFMHDKGTYDCSVSEKVTMVKIPFGNQAYNLIIFLPKENVDIEEALDEIVLNNLAYGGTPYELELSLPKFKAEKYLELNDVLKSLGISDIFNPKADFSALSPYPSYVNKVVQSSVFEINEAGGEGASVTASMLCTSIGPGSEPEPSELKVDVNRPFIFAVAEASTYAQIFIGAMLDI